MSNAIEHRAKQRNGPISHHKRNYGVPKPPTYIYPVQKGWSKYYPGIEQLWQNSRGAGVKIAVLDTGVDLSHPDLRGQIKAKYNALDDSEDVTDESGHGTHICGVIAASGVSACEGVAPQAALYVAKVARKHTISRALHLTKAVKWAIAQQVHIISISQGTRKKQPALHKAIKEAAAQGIIVICSAGNHGEMIDAVTYPARYPETIAVGALNRELVRPYFSSKGPSVDIVAPGNQIYSTVPGGNYHFMRGTSMATPFISGLVALKLAVHDADPRYFRNVKTLRKALKHMCIDLGVPGKDDDYGFGMIDAQALLNYCKIKSKEMIKDEPFVRITYSYEREEYDVHVSILPSDGYVVKEITKGEYHTTTQTLDLYVVMSYEEGVETYYPIQLTHSIAKNAHNRGKWVAVGIMTEEGAMSSHPESKPKNSYD